MSTVWCHLQEGGKCLQFGVTDWGRVSVLQFGVTDRRVSVYSLVSLTEGG